MTPQQTAREARQGHRTRTQDECLQELEAGALALGDVAHEWRARPPSIGGIAGAEAALEGLRPDSQRVAYSDLNQGPLMHEIPERKRSKVTGKGSGPKFLQLMHWIVRTQEFGSLKGSPLKMLIDLGSQFNGNNNGDLCPALLRNSGRWKSEETMSYALKCLVDDNWIVRTKRGGLGMGPDLYAITWWPVDACDGRHDYPTERVASQLWAKKSPHRNPVLLAPDSGVAVAPKEAENVSNTPESGVRNGVFRAA